MTTQPPSGYIISPLSKRPIRVGGKRYQQLVSDNILQKQPESRKQSIVYEGMNANAIVKNMKLEKDTNIRAKQDKQIIKYRRRIKRNELVDNTLNKTMEVVIQNRELFNNDQSDEEIDTILKQLIHQNMVENNNNNKLLNNNNNKLLNKTNNTKKKFNIKVLDPVFSQQEYSDDDSRCEASTGIATEGGDTCIGRAEHQKALRQAEQSEASDASSSLSEQDARASDDFIE